MPFQERNPELQDLLKADFVSWDHLRLFGPQLGIRDILRGHKDDFFGDQIRDEYDITDFAGAGSAAPVLVDGAHGGWVRLTSGPAAGRYSRLWLGDAADGYDTLKASDGWVMIVRCEIDSIVTTGFSIGAFNSAFDRFVLMGYNNIIGANWVVAAMDGVFSFTAAATGPVANTPYWMALKATSDLITIYVDGIEVATHANNIPVDVLTPIIYCEGTGAGSNSLDVDFWAVIPRNL